MKPGIIGLAGLALLLVIRSTVFAMDDAGGSAPRSRVELTAVAARLTGSTGTTVSGYIAVDTTWGLAGSPYIVASDVTILPGATLTIQPGVTVQFSPGTQLWVKGGASPSNLVAIGTPESPILFTRDGSNGTWSRIYVDSYASTANITLEYVTVEYATNGLHLNTNRTSSVIVRHSMFRNNGNGLTTSAVAYGWDVVQITDNLISNNGIGIYASSFWASLVGNTITDNTGDGILLGNGNATLEHNLIYRNGGHGINADISNNGSSRFRYNTIANNGGSGIHLSSSYTGANPVIQSNSIVGNGSYALENTRNSDSDIDATNNWWGTTDQGSIGALIYDFFDDSGAGIVSYQPFATGMVPETPDIPGMETRTPTASPSPMNTTTPTATRTPTPTSTPLPSATPTVTATPSPEIDLSAGWNLLSYPYPPGTSIPATDLVDRMHAQGLAVSHVARWQDGAWQSFVPGFGPGDWLLVYGRGYFVRIAAPGRWRP